MHRWRQFLFTTNHLFPVTATKIPKLKENTDFSETWTLANCTASLYSTIVLWSLFWELPVLGVFKGNDMILLRKSTDGANYYLQQTICFLQQQHYHCATQVYFYFFRMKWRNIKNTKWWNNDSSTAVCVTKKPSGSAGVCMFVSML